MKGNALRHLGPGVAIPFAESLPLHTKGRTVDSMNRSAAIFLFENPFEWIL
jgi:hypothetical protein